MYNPHLTWKAQWKLIPCKAAAHQQGRLHCSAGLLWCSLQVTQALLLQEEHLLPSPPPLLQIAVFSLNKLGAEAIWSLLPLPQGWWQHCPSAHRAQTLLQHLPNCRAILASNSQMRWHRLGLQGSMRPWPSPPPGPWGARKSRDLEVLICNLLTDLPQPGMSPTWLGSKTFCVLRGNPWMQFNKSSVYLCHTSLRLLHEENVSERFFWDQNLQKWTSLS